MDSLLYSSYKAIGYVTDGSNFIINRLGNEIFLTTSIGKSFQVYRFDKLSVCLVSAMAPKIIQSMAVIGLKTYVGIDHDIFIYKRTKICHKLKYHHENIMGMISIGHYLLSYDSNKNVIVFDTKSRKQISRISLIKDHGSITIIFHPACYINKMVIGFDNGDLELWNFTRSSLIYSFQSHQKYLQQYHHHLNHNYSYGAISCLEQSPACDVIGIGFSTGDILIMNLKLDTILFSFHYEKNISVTSLSFRTDVMAENFPFLASSDPDGKIYIWNLGQKKSNHINMNYDHDDTDGSNSIDYIIERKLQYIIDDAHMNTISKIEFLYGEPILTSCSHDNSIKIWIFDSPDGSARLLRSRQGHCGYPLRIRYYGGITNMSIHTATDAHDCEILSCGTDQTLRLFNSVLENQNREFSQKIILKKYGYQKRHERLPTIIGYDYSEAREKEWGNLVTIHLNHSCAYVWNYKSRTITDLVLKQSEWNTNNMKYVVDSSTHSTAVCLSPCGNYCAIGSKGGIIYLYNIQSGLSRGSFPKIQIMNEKKVNRIKKLSSTPGNVFEIRKQIQEQSKGSEANSLKIKSNSSNEIVTQTPIDDYDGHDQEISGLFIDLSVSVLVTCGKDGQVIFWDFTSHQILTRHTFQTAHTLLQGLHDSNFVAIAGQDRTIRLFDITGKNMIRKFTHVHSREITDLAFSPDGRRLISSSIDKTVRVFDLTSSRCLSWLEFDSPVMSITVSHSGEYLCVAQAEKQGIYMYVDKSLFETVHFTHEPLKPQKIGDSVTKTEISFDHETEFNETNLIEDVEMNSTALTPTQAQILPDDVSATQTVQPKSNDALTLSAVPRAYWATLFHLELIKERNKPIAPPEAPKQAPFFLPTVVSSGVAPSFPTPKEYQKLLSNDKTNEEDAAIDNHASKNKNKRKNLKEGSDVNNDSGKKMKTVLSESENQMTGEDEKIMAELASLGTGVWNDNDNNDDVDEVSWGIDAVKEKSDAENLESIERVKSSRLSSSRILKKQVNIPRCKLAFLLSQQCSHTDAMDISIENGQQASESESNIIEYLKSISPPAVDVEFRALCSHITDHDGVQLIHTLLLFLKYEISTGKNYEILQAYLYRLLFIYADLIMDLFHYEPADGFDMILIHDIQQIVQELLNTLMKNCDKFRNLIQKNLCLLKLLTGLPPV